QIASRTVARIDVDWGETSRHTTVDKSRKRVDRIELVAIASEKCAAEKRIEEILTAQRDRQSFVRLTRKQGPILSFAGSHRHVGDVFRRAACEKPVRDAELNLIGIGNGIDVVETNYSIEIINARDFPVNHVGFDHVPEEKAAAAVEVFCQRWWPDVQLKLSIRPRHVPAENVACGRIHGVGVESHAAGAGSSDAPTGEVQRQLKPRMQIESLHDRRRDDRVPANVVNKLDQVLNSFLATHAIRFAAE